MIMKQDFLEYDNDLLFSFNMDYILSFSQEARKWYLCY